MTCEPLLDIPAGHGRVLDLGCGTGWVLAQARGMEHASAFGVDLDEAGMRKGREQNPRISFCIANASQLPFRRSCFRAVIGHVSLPYMPVVETLRELNRVLEDGGFLWLSVHNLRYWRSRMKTALAKGNLKDFVFLFYMLANMLALHFGLPQFRFLQGTLETVMTARGMERALQAAGFNPVKLHWEGDKIWSGCWATCRK